MPFLTLTPEALAALRGAASSVGFRQTAERIPGSQLFRVPIDDDVAVALDAKRFHGESDSDVVVRIIALHGRKPQ